MDTNNTPPDDVIMITMKDHGDMASGPNPSRYEAKAKKGEALVGFGTGKCWDEAIGAVVRANPEYFNIKIEAFES